MLLLNYLYRSRGGLKRFALRQDGAIAIVFALVLIPIMLMVGVVVDLSRVYSVRRDILQAADSAGISALLFRTADSSKLEGHFKKYFAANYDATKESVTNLTTTLTISSERIHSWITADVPMVFMQIAGYSHVTVNVESTVLRRMNDLDLALVLGVADSMKGYRMQAMTKAAKGLVDILSEDTDYAKDHLQIGLVPFASTVNIGAAAMAEWKTKGWLDVDNKSSVNGINFDGSDAETNVFTIYGQLKKVTWFGCVEARSKGLDVTDTPPSSGNSNSLWVPYFAPDEPDFKYYHNNYMLDKVEGSAEERQRSVVKYEGSKVPQSALGNVFGPNQLCNKSEIIDLTNNTKLLKQRISTLTADGWTHIPLGAVWGWRLLTPGAPYTKGRDPDTDKVVKVMVVLTDGQNTYPQASSSSHNGSDYSSYGYITDDRIAADTVSDAPKALNDKLDTICTNAKKDGIVIYTITFQVNDKTAKQVMEDCASSAMHYYDSSSSSALKKAFEAIALSLRGLRISQ